MIDYPDDTFGDTREPGDFWRNAKGQPKVSRPEGRKRVGRKADLIATAHDLGIPVPDKVTVDQLHELLGRETGARFPYGRCSWWPFDDYTGIDIIHADRGTWAHTVTEWIDRRGGFSPDEELPGDIVAEGDRLEIPQDVQQHCARDWVAFRERTGLRPVHIEATVVNDDYQVAGTLDGIDEATEPIETPWGIVAPGDHVVVDKKTSDEIERPAYACQLARYHGAVPYDVETDERGQWSKPLNDAVAFIAQYRMAAKIAGEDIRWELRPCSLDVGHDLATTIHELANVDVSHAFKIATPASSPAVESPAEGAERTANAPAPSAMSPLLEASRDVTEQQDAKQSLDDLRDYMRRTFSDADRKALAAYFDANDTDRTDPAQVAEAIAAVEGFRDVATTPAERPQVATIVPPMLPAVTDEGPDIDDATLAAAGKAYAGLADVPRGWVSLCGSKVRLNPASGGVASVRRFELLRGLCILAEAGFDNDDAARAVLAAILGDIVWQQVPVADAVAALDVEEAKRFARICDAVTASLTPFEFPDDGRTVIDAKVLEVAA